ncbi:MAG: HEAT repeat domain-containing protein [Aggregatilineales bacterium]
MSQNTIISQLKSSDPKTRFEAVKQAARARDQSALRTLSTMAASDPDPQVRAAAAKAEQYIRQKTGAPAAGPSGNARRAAPAVDGAAVDSFKQKQREVSEADIARAHSYLEAALTYQTNNERAKALKAMTRALELHPGIINDNYFRSVLDEITGLSGADSLALLTDQSEQRRIAATEAQLKKEKRVQGHLGKVQRTTWASAGMDLIIYTMILIFGGLILVLAFSQTAASIRPAWYEAERAYVEALARGETPSPPERPSEALEIADQITAMNIGLPQAVVFGLVLGVSGVIGVVLQLAATHVAARFVLGGHGTLPYLIYRVVSFYNGRLPIVMFLLIVAVVALVSGNGGLYLVLMGFLAIFSLYMTFAVLSRVSQAYDFGLARGCLAWIVGGLLLSVVMSLPMLLVMGAALGQVLRILGGPLSF